MIRQEDIISASLLGKIQQTGYNIYSKLEKVECPKCHGYRRFSVYIFFNKKCENCQGSGAVDIYKWYAEKMV